MPETMNNIQLELLKMGAMLLSSRRHVLDHQNNSNDFLFPLSESDADDETDPDRIFQKGGRKPLQIPGVFSVTGVQVGWKRQSPFEQSVLSGAGTSPINLSKGCGENSNPLAKT